MKKRVIILGSTGSIGTSALDAVEHQQDEFEVVGLACRENAQLFTEQIRKFKPRLACLYDNSREGHVDFGNAKRLVGEAGMTELVKSDAEIVINALPGSIGLQPTIETLRQEKTLCLANKESLVMAGRLIAGLTRHTAGRLIPVDSEHSALFQLMEGIDRQEIETLVITASGGPFKNHSKEELRKVTPDQALQHPTWRMGRKVTIDSATLMNKGLEVIEARWLFDIDHEKIRIVVHAESIVHGMLQLVDGSFFAYMAYPDMRIPIAFALNSGKRKRIPFGKMDLVDLGSLTFTTPDMDRFPALKLAYEALESGDSALITLNAANEVASSAFLDGRIAFTDIPRLVEEALARQPGTKEIDDLETIWEIHGWAKRYCEDQLRRINAS